MWKASAAYYFPCSCDMSHKQVVKQNRVHLSLALCLMLNAAKHFHVVKITATIGRESRPIYQLI